MMVVAFCRQPNQNVNKYRELDSVQKIILAVVIGISTSTKLFLV